MESASSGEKLEHLAKAQRRQLKVRKTTIIQRQHRVEKNKADGTPALGAEVCSSPWRPRDLPPPRPRRLRRVSQESRARVLKPSLGLQGEARLGNH